jgi:hypothetical protein
MNETNILSEQAYNNESLNRKQIYKIITEVNKEKGSAFQWYSNPKKWKRIEDAIAAFAAAIEEDHRQTVRGLASLYGQSYDTIRRILY